MIKLSELHEDDRIIKDGESMCETVKDLRDYIKNNDEYNYKGTWFTTTKTDIPLSFESMLENFCGNADGYEEFEVHVFGAIGKENIKKIQSILDECKEESGVFATYAHTEEIDIWR